MKKFFLLAIIYFLCFSADAQYNKTVARDGSGDFTTLQAAIDASPSSSATPWVIYIKNGKYNEKVIVPSTKPNIQLIGESVADVIIYFNDYASRPLPGGGTSGQNSATIVINATDFVALNVSFINTYNFDSAYAIGSASQALAVFVNADRVAFKNCRFIGMQDTLLTKGTNGARNYFYKCYIDGIVDFIYGNAVAIYDSCVIYAKTRTGIGNSYITAANTPPGQTYGYLFRDCVMPANTGGTLYVLGRPWGNSNGSVTSNTKVVFFNTAMSHSINPAGWAMWDATTNTSVITYAEFKTKNINGTLANVSNRVSWSQQFTNADTVGYNIPNMFNGWNPCSVRTDFCSYANPELAVSNFKGVKSGSNTNFTWNISWAVTGVTYDLYRSIDNKTSYQLLSSSTALNDTAINFVGVDGVPPSCTSYFYFVKASKTSYSTTYTDTIEVSSVPTTTTNTRNLINFLQGSTAPSASQTFVVNAVNLLNNVTITAPTNFEISLDNTNWSVNPIVLTQVAGSVANTIVYVRLNAATANTYTGNILLTTTCSASTITDSITVSGVTQSTPLLNFSVLQQWDLTTDNNDNATVRAMGLTATIPTFNKLYSSNGTQLTNIPAYSTQFGQAFGASTNGDGSWGTGSGGPGSILNRTFYEQFTVTPSTGYMARIDSIILTTAFYNTSSGIKLAAVYSRSNFVNDSSDVTGGIDRTGLTLAGTANGGFLTPVLLSNQTGGPTASYSLALNAGDGVNIGVGETLTIRLYYACGSSSTGRYAMLKNVQMKGTVSQTVPLQILSYELKVKNDKKIENIWTTANEINVSHFNIQRSVNGKDFINIGNVNAKNKIENSYSFIDEIGNLELGTKYLYYRLEAIDKDGKVSYSVVKKIELKGLNAELTIYPNPATSIVTIECANAKQLLIIDYLGRTVKQFKVSSEKLIINTKQFAKGLYTVQIITTNGDLKTEKLMIQ